MTNPEEQAFPRNYAYQNPEAGKSELKSHPGLTKREWFAGQALRGMCEWDAEHNEPTSGRNVQIIVEGCVGLADALIAELNKEVKP